MFSMTNKVVINQVAKDNFSCSEPFEFETKKEAKLAKLQHHTITQILLILFKYIYTIKLFKI